MQIDDMQMCINNFDISIRADSIPLSYVWYTYSELSI